MTKNQKVSASGEDWVGILMCSGQKRLDELARLAIWAVSQRHDLLAIVDVDDVESLQEITASSRASGNSVQWVVSGFGAAGGSKRLADLPMGYVIATATPGEPTEQARLLEHLLTLRGR